MKLLLDTCVSGAAMASLKAAGHDVIWAGDWPADPGDEEILALAYQEGRILITLDKDFAGWPSFVSRRMPGLFAWWSCRPPSKPPFLMVLKRYGAELQSGAIVTVEPGRIRVRPAASHPESS